MSDCLHNVIGHCLCNAVKITVKELDPQFGACHCDNCRRWSGGPMLAADCGEDVTFEHRDAIGTYDSSEWAQRGFCKNCGTHLFFKLIGSGQYILPLGLFDLDNQLSFDHQIFIDHKPEYYSFANDTTLLTGEQVFAGFSDQEEHDHDSDHH